jgi:methylphosphotriester-DNA--protein-cysteine methyltransferase
MPDAPDNKRIAKRIDADGRMQVGPNWETLIERQIREAMEHGKFDELPRRGEPLPNDENPYAGDMALAFHMLKNAGVAPPWVEADKEVRELLARRDHILMRASTGPVPSVFARKRDRETLTKLVTDANAAISKVNAESPTQLPQRRLLVLAQVLADYDAACRR